MAVRKSGKSWSARINWRDANGQLHQMEKGGFKTKVEAEQYSVEQQYLHTKGVDIESNPVFADYFHEWWTTFKKPHIRHETQQRYETNDRIIHQYFGDVKIKKIKRLKARRGRQRQLGYLTGNSGPASRMQLQMD